MAAFAIPLAIAGINALGGLFGGNKSTSQSTTTTTPNFTPQQQSMINMLTGQYSSAIKNAPAWNQAYQTSGVQNFLNNSINANSNANSALSSRGIDRTTAGAQTVADTGYQEGNQIANFLAQAPIAEQTNLNTLLNQASSFNASLPVGTTSSSNTTSTGNAPISPVAGFLGGGAQGLSAALGQQNAATILGNILKGLPTNNTPTTSAPSSSSSSSSSTGSGVDPALTGGSSTGASDNWWEQS